ncbi:MAG: histidinol-phosphatase [bacterium]
MILQFDTMLGNLHTHTNFSDGSDFPEAYVNEAIRKGFSVLGFSDHSPIPLVNSFSIREGSLPEYCKAISSIQSSSLHLLLGLEYDYIPGLTRPVSDLRASFPFDYIIGSVHLVRNAGHESVWFIDGPNRLSYDSGISDVFEGDVRKAVITYWRQLQAMILREQPDIIGHLDKIKMHNKDRFFQENEPWYVKLVDETLELIKQSGAVVEVNTRGIYKKRSDTLFPGPDILKKILHLQIPITVTSDAHRPEELAMGFPEAKTILNTIGFRSEWSLGSTGWKELPL